MMKEIKAALFDLDGTLFDTEGQYTTLWGGIGRKYRPDIPNFAQEIKGTTLKQILDRYFPDESVREAIVKELNEYEAQMTYDFYPGALDCISDLKKHGVRCAIVTSSNISKMKQVEKQIPEFNNLFDRVLTSEDFTASKPAPDCYLLGAKVFGCKLDECVVFEDALSGLQSGMSAGIFTFGLATTNTEEAIKEHCNHVLASWQGVNYDTICEIFDTK